MSELVRLFINPYGLTYLAILVGLQILYRQWQKKQRNRTATQRLTRGLPANSLLSRTEKLQDRQQLVSIEIVLWVISTLVVPAILMAIARTGKSTDIATVQNGLFVMAITLWLLTAVGGLGALSALVSGFMFQAIAAFTVPFQPGDHIAIMPANSAHNSPPITGKVIRLSAFFVTLENLAGQRTNIPTHTLWRRSVTVLNSNGRIEQLGFPLGSQCKVVFYLSPTATPQQLRLAENVILEIVRHSAYIESSSPTDIHCAQTYHAIELTAIAYVAAIENAAAFSSDTTRQFLDLAQQKRIPLAVSTEPFPAQAMTTSY